MDGGSPRTDTRLRHPLSCGHHARGLRRPGTLPCLLPDRALNPGWALFISSNAANEVAVNFFVVYSM